MIEHRVILLERDAQRVTHINMEFSEMIQDNQISIFPAVDGEKDDLQEKLKNLEIDVAPDFAGRATSGQVGCAISHMMLWSELKESDTKRCVVLEDDVSLTENYRHNLEVVLSELPSEWEFVLLFTHPEHSHIKNRKEIPGKMQLLNRIPTWGTVGYLISKTGVDKFLSRFSQTGIYAPIDIMIQDSLAEMKSYNLKNDLVLTVGQLTESDEDKELMKSNVWQSNTYKQILRKMNPDQIYISNKQAEIKSQNVLVDSAEVGFFVQTEQYSTTFHLEDRAPSKGDRVSFHLSIPVPSDFLDNLLLRFSIRSHYQGLEYSGRMSYSFHMNEKEIFHENVGQFNKVNNVSLIIPKRPDSGLLELELRLDVMRDCEDWNWGPISKITAGDFSIETVENYDSYYLSTTSPYSINLIRHESSELKSLIQELASTGELIDVFIPGGNRGDGLIYQGAFKLFRQFGLKYNLLPYRYNNVLEEFVDQPRDANTLLIMGSGGFSHGFNLMVEIVPELVKKYALVYILPTTFDITYTPVKKFLEELPEHVSVFCREQKSHSDLIEIIPPQRLFLDHDTAFEFDYSKWMKGGHGVLNAFRDDKESSAIQLPIGNQDVSTGPDSQWKELLDIISQYSVIHTNRAHVSIAAALMGKETHIYPSSYFKQKEIFRYSLSNRKNVKFHSEIDGQSDGKFRVRLNKPIIAEGRVDFSWETQGDEKYIRGSQFFYDFGEANLSECNPHSFDNLCIGILFSIWRNESVIQLDSETPINTEIIEHWRKYWEIENIEYIGKSSESIQLLSIENNQFRENDSPNNGIGLLFGGGKDSMMAAGILSEVAPERPLYLLSFLHPNSQGTDFRNKLRERRTKLVLDPVSELREVQVIIVETDLLGRALTEKVRYAPHIAVYSATLAIISEITGISDVFFNYEMPHYWVREHGKQDPSPYFLRSRPEYLEFTSTHISKLTGQPFCLSNMSLGTNIHLHFTILSQRYPELWNFNLTCEAQLNLENRYCHNCHKCFFISLFGILSGNIPNGIDVEQVISGPFFGEKSGPELDKLSPQNGKNSLHLGNIFGIFHQMDLGHWAEQIDLKSSNLSDEAISNLKKLKVHYGNEIRDEVTKYYFQALKHLPEWFQDPFEKILKEYASPSETPEFFLFNNKRVVFNYDYSHDF